MVRCSELDGSVLCGPEQAPPLARTWNPFHLYPKGSYALMRDGPWITCEHFHRLAYALAETNRRVTSLRLNNGGFGGGLPPFALTKPNMSDSDLGAALAAYANLEDLNISIDAKLEDASTNPCPLAALPILLLKMSSLKTLRLSLAEDYPSADRPPRYRYDQVFPMTLTTSNLRMISISGLSVRAFDLLWLLSGHPHLHYLRLEHIDLLEGSWEGVIERFRCLKCKPLETSFLVGNFTHHGSERFLPPTLDRKYSEWEFRLDIEDYVVYGGNHPCLTPDSPLDILSQWEREIYPDEWLKAAKFHARVMGVPVAP